MNFHLIIWLNARGISTQMMIQSAVMTTCKFLANTSSYPELQGGDDETLSEAYTTIERYHI